MVFLKWFLVKNPISTDEERCKNMWYKIFVSTNGGAQFRDCVEEQWLSYETVVLDEVEKAGMHKWEKEKKKEEEEGDVNPGWRHCSAPQNLQKTKSSIIS